MKADVRNNPRIFANSISIDEEITSVQKGVGALVVLGFVSALGLMVYSTPWIQLPNSEPAETTKLIGNLLMMDYLLPFEAASFLLLGALIGATTLSRKDY